MTSSNKPREKKESSIRNFTLRHRGPNGENRGGGFGDSSIWSLIHKLEEPWWREQYPDDVFYITKFLSRNEDGSWNDMTVWEDGAFVHEPRVTAFLGKELLDLEKRLSQVKTLINKADRIIFNNDER